MDDVGAIQRGLEQLDRLRASRNGHAGLTAATGIDLSRPAYALLRRIDEHGPATLGDLSRATGMDAASTGRQVRRLEELGFFERAPDASDGRVVTVSITPAGHDARKHIAEVLEAHLRDTLGRWSASDRHLLGELLTRLVDDFRDIQFRNVRSTTA
ncbi:MAG TPA: MarR family transcriptional regulator [Acidimicrobiia bacterium]|jgi:DNA-binding MarR family transcriptional regulator